MERQRYIGKINGHIETSFSKVILNDSAQAHMSQRFRMLLHLAPLQALHESGRAGLLCKSLIVNAKLQLCINLSA